MNIIGQLFCSLDEASIKLGCLLVNGQLSRANKMLKGSEYKMHYALKWTGEQWKNNTREWDLIDKQSYIRARMYFKNGSPYAVRILHSW